MNQVSSAWRLSRRAVLGGVVAAGLPGPRAHAQEASLKIAVLTDMSGPFRDITGPGSVAGVHQALEDFGVSGKTMKVEVVVGDHQNKPDIGAAIARQWFDRDGVDCIVDVPNSAVALAIQQIAREKNKVYLNASLATNRLTGDLCSPNLLHWTGDTHMLARSTGGAMMAAGDKDWFLLIANYALGHQLEANMNAMAAKGLGRIAGRAAYPFLETTDFSSFLLQAQASGAKVLGLANVGQEARNAIKQAAEFGITRTMKIAGLLMFIQDIHALGLQAAQGLYLTETFYWDLNDRTRAFTNPSYSRHCWGSVGGHVVRG